jgi:hypothetical protein
MFRIYLLRHESVLRLHEERVTEGDTENRPLQVKESFDEEWTDVTNDASDVALSKKSK